ncbi:sodium-dependent proline transporter-like isoform X2 [Babylonia areolata]|uniref:sodium-dependent proline transporter-like isoform X2 n=1 Tax=Babylonia areolata TaxID=304850 RepID=UPI003FD2636C
MPRSEKVGAGVTLADVSGSDSSMSSSSSLDDKEDRGTWTGRMDFLLSCIGFAVGLGNIWRFPYLCYKSGGGAFLVPYVVFLVLCGMPLFFMEITYGQFASLSPITVWRISPLFKGVGYGMVIISGIVCVYYNIIITWTFYYLFMSMRKVLPWSDCDNAWNDERCVLNKFADANSTDANATMVNGTVVNSTYATAANVTLNSSHLMTASEQFWERNVLEITDGIEDMGTIRWPLFGCLALAWVVVFLCLCKGVKSSGRVVYVTATFPYLVLIILLVRGATLPGALEGIKFYLIPDWQKLLEFKVWGDAAIQIFYSVGMAWGGLITMASYNKFHNNVYRDAIIVPLMNCGTSVFAGLVIFSVLGFMAHETGAEIKDVVTQGPGLTFVVYPEAVAKLPISPLWALLFFLMLFTIGLDSQFGMFETMTSAFIDEFPHLLKNKKVLFTAIMCFIEFVLGIPCVFQGGIYVLQIMDWYCATFSLMLLSFTECVVISWVYGVDRFYKDIELMIGFKPSAYWKILWCFITPATILFIWVFSVSQLAPVSYGTYQYPTWAIIFGWMLGLCSLLPLPIVMIISIAKEKGTLWQRVRKLARPADNWGPALPENREAYLASLEPCHRPAATLELPSPIYSPKKGGVSGGAAVSVLMPEERKLLSDSVTTMSSDRSVTAQSTEFTSMLSDGQTLPVSKC